MSKNHRFPGQGAQSVYLRQIGREARQEVYKSWQGPTPYHIPSPLAGAFEVAACVAAFAGIGFVLGVMA